MEMVHFIPSSQRRIALMAAQADSEPVLIHGTAGSGKTSLAHWIHSNGPRATKTFSIARNDFPLTDQILSAQGGTLVIPEIGELNFSDQRSLLLFLKTKSVLKKGTEQDPGFQAGTDGVPTIANVRIISTTSQTLEGRAQGGLFNIELLKTLNFYRIEMPPLSDRQEEFEDIVLGIIGEITRELHKDHIKGLKPEAWERLKSYDWPGNLRELRNVLRLAVTATKGDQVEIFDLPDFGYTKIDFRATREQFEKIYILVLLKTFNWEVDKTCQMTRIDKSTLMSKIKHYGITIETTAIS